MKSMRGNMICATFLLLTGVVQGQSNQVPVVSISGGSRAFVDTDNVMGEIINVTGTASDSDGTIVKTVWTVNGSEVAMGSSAALALRDGWNDVAFTATDNGGAQSTREVHYQVDRPSRTLPRLDGLSTEEQTSASQFSVAIRNSTSALVTSASRAQALTLTAYVFPQADDINNSADIFVVVKTPSGWFMRGLDGSFVPWSTNIAELVPAYENQRLQESVRVLIHAGKLFVVGEYKLFTGYRRTDGTELVYTGTGADLKITH